MRVFPGISKVEPSVGVLGRNRENDRCSLVISAPRVDECGRLRVDRTGHWLRRRLRTEAPMLRGRLI